MTEWKTGSIIRNIETNRPYLVVHVYTNICTIIFDLSILGVIRPVHIILEADYDKFARDIEFSETKCEDGVELHYKKLPKL